MAEQGPNGISWTNRTWNPIRGCSVVSEGCRNCYAMQVAARFNQPGQAYEGLAYRNTSGAHWTGDVKLIEEHLEDPLRWKRPRRIFVNSMSDLFHESIPDGWIERIVAVMFEAKRHTFQVLTKRPARMKKFVLERAEVFRQPQLHWPNVWLGVSVEDQKTANERIPILLETPAAVRWISAEPLLGPIDLRTGIYAVSDGRYGGTQLEGIQWVVVGGESGAGARPMHPDWAKSLRDQCVAAGVPFFFKQWGEYRPATDVECTLPEGWPHIKRIGPPLHCFPEPGPPDAPDTVVARVGKKASGHLLDGREWHEYPEAKAS